MHSPSRLGTRIFTFAAAALALLASPSLRSAETLLELNDGSPDRSRVKKMTLEIPSGRALVPSSLRIHSLGAQDLLDPASISLTADADRYILRFTDLPGGALADGNYLLSLLTRPDGGGNARSQETFPFHAWFGDQDGDRDVDYLDTSFFWKTWKLPAGAPGFDARFDHDADGLVNETDLLPLRNNYFRILPPAASVSAYLATDDGDSNTDNITSDPTIRGDLNFNPAATAISVRGDVRRASAAAPNPAVPYPGNLTGDMVSTTAFALTEARLQALSSAPLEPGVPYLFRAQLVTPDNTVVARDAVPFTVTPGRGNMPPQFVAPGNRVIPPTLAFSTTIFALDPDPADTLTFSVVSGPSGLTIDAASGRLDWPSPVLSAQPFVINLRVEDREGASDTGSFTITVEQPEIPTIAGAAPSIVVPGDGSLLVGETFAAAVTATDPDPGDSLVFSLSRAPAGMTIDPASGSVSWTPALAQTGPQEITARVTDSSGLSDFGTFTVTPRLPNRGPLAVDDIFTTPKGVTTTIPATGVLANDTDPDDNPLTVELVSSPINGTLALRADGSFDYTPGTGLAPFQAKLAAAYKQLDGSPWRVNNNANPSDDGKVSAADLDGDGKPEIIAVGQRGDGIFNTGWLLALKFDETTGTLAPLWKFFGTFGSQNSIYSAPEPAIGDVTGDGVPEVVVAAQCRGDFLVFSNTGELLVNTQAGKNVGGFGDLDCFGINPMEAPYIADLDGDGLAEIIIQSGEKSIRVCNGIGEEIWKREVGPVQGRLAVADVNLDGELEIYFGGTLFSANGDVIWTLPDPPTLLADSFAAIANLDDDPFAEIVTMNFRVPVLRVIEHDGSCKWVASGSPDPPQNSGCGTPLPFPISGVVDTLIVADINGDGQPEILVGTSQEDQRSNTVIAFDRFGTVLWQTVATVGTAVQTQTSLAAFDFDGDGIMEIVVCGLRGTTFLSGLDGSKKFEIPGDAENPGNLSAFPILNPIVVDLENDGHAELVIGVNDASSPKNGVFVYKDVNDRWMPTRSVWNQSRYSITNVNADGTIPRKPAVNWLTPGLNNYNVNLPMPDESSSSDRFTYRITDGEFTSNVATVTLEIGSENKPPVILSTPSLTAVPDYAYTYRIFATDPNVGDEVTLSYIHGPAGMTFEDSSRLRWTPTAADLGEHSVTIAAEDKKGLTTLQNFTLRVIPAQAVPDVVGQTQATALVTLDGAGFTGGKIAREDHPTVAAGLVISQLPLAGASEIPGTAVALIVSNGPGPGNTDGDGDGFTPNQGDCDDTLASIFPGAPDPAGDGIDQDCDGIDGSLILASILVEPVSPLILTNQNVPLTATGIFTDGTSQNLTAVVTWSGGVPRFSSATAGEFTVTATRDTITGSTNIAVVAQVADAAPPLALITSPASGTTVTEPTDIVGSALDPNFLKYELAYAPAGTEDFTVFASGNSPVSGASLGKFDPTVLINDQYTIRLTVFDRGRNRSTAEIGVLVDENMKVGNFALTFTDLQIPLSGIPLTISRTYDSRDKGKGDFGVGWRLGIQSLKLRSNRVPGTGWNVVKQGLAFGLQPTDAHIIGLTLPDGRTEIFDLVVTPLVSPLVPFPPSVLTARLVPRPGTLGKLESMENNTLSIFANQPGPVELLEDISLDAYNPQRFRYTAPDGTIIMIHAKDGVQSVTEPNGNTLTFNSGGIFHSSGRSVLFTRDSAGRITSLTDPMGDVQRYGYDSNGDLRVHTDAEGNQTRYAYNRTHGLLRITDPLNRVIARNDYDDDGRLIRITNANGRIINLTHDLSTRQEIITDAGGQATVMEYDDLGNVVRATNALGGVTTNTYDEAGNQLTTTNPEGETATRTFDSRRNLLTESNALGETTTLTYNVQDKVTSRTDPLGRVTRFEYTASGNLSKTIDATGTVSRSNDYDAKGNLIAATDARGFTTTYEYDSAGNQTAEIDPNGVRSATLFNERGDLTKEIDGRGTVMLTTVDARGLFTKKKDPLGNVSEFTFNENGVMTEVADALGNVSSQEVDAVGNDLSITDATGYKRSKTYDIRGNTTSTPNTVGQSLLHEYDELSRRVRTISPDGGIDQQFPDKVGRVARTVDALGNETLMEYDDAGRNTKITDALGHITKFEYNAAGNLIHQTDAKGNVFQFEYDDLDRLILTRLPDGSTTSMGYDASGNVVSGIDAAGFTTTYSYDPVGRLTEVSDPLGRLSWYAYDADGNLLAQTDANGHVTRFAYDANGRRVGKTYPDGTIETQKYDTGGRVASVTDAAGLATQMEYDAAGRPLHKTFPDATSESFTYTQAGQLATATNRNGTVSYAYDTNGRLAGIKDPDDSTVAYAYDLAGNRTAVTTKLPGGSLRTTRYTFDALTRIETVADPEGEVTRYAYDEIGNLASISYPNGVVSTYVYDSLSRLDFLTHRKGIVALASYSYEKNAVGDRTKATNTNGSYVIYEYDGRRRLLREAHHDLPGTKSAEWIYSYDAVGNRQTLVDSGGLETRYTYDAADKLLHAGPTAFSYDARGNVVSRSASDGNTDYIFNHENELNRVDTPGGSVEFAYDAVGERIQTAGGGATINHLVDRVSPTGFSQVLSDHDPVGGSATEYTYGPELIGMRDGASTRYHHSDGSRNVRLLSDGAGNVSDTYVYNAFGERIERTGSTSNPYQFAGERYGDLEKLLYLRARYYDASTGRFIGKDPFEGTLRDPISLHRYLYANANPVMFTDPSGQFAYAELGVAAGINAGISLIGSGIANESWQQAVPKAIFAAVFAAAGGAAGIGVGKGVTALGNKLLTHVGSGFASVIARQGLVTFAVIFTKAIVGTLLSIPQSMSDNYSDGKDLNDGITWEKFKGTLVINLSAEILSYGLLSSLEIFDKRGVANAAESLVSKRVFNDFLKSDSVDIIDFIRRGARQGSRSLKPAVELIPDIEKLADEFVLVTVRNAGIISKNQEANFAAFMEGTKGLISKALGY